MSLERLLFNGPGWGPIVALAVHCADFPKKTDPQYWDKLRTFKGFLTLRIQHHTTVNTITHLFLSGVCFLPKVAKIIPSPARWILGALTLVSAIHAVACRVLPSLIDLAIAKDIRNQNAAVVAARATAPRISEPERKALLHLQFLMNYAVTLPGRVHAAAAVPDNLKTMLGNTEKVLSAPRYQNMRPFIALLKTSLIDQGHSPDAGWSEACTSARPLLQEADQALSDSEIAHHKESVKTLIHMIQYGPLTKTTWAGDYAQWLLLKEAHQLAETAGDDGKNLSNFLYRVIHQDLDPVSSPPSEKDVNSVLNHDFSHVL